MVTCKQKQKQLAQILSSHQIEDAEFEAKLLLEHITGVSSAAILLGAHYPDAFDPQIEALLQKRLAGFPMQYLLGEWEFFGMAFTVGEGVLIPRQDTEILVETAVTFLKNKHDPTLLDLCSGTGCIPLAVGAHTPLQQAYAVEFSEAAYDYLLQNLARYPDIPLQPILADALSANTLAAFDDQSLDCITSNPPYLSDTEMRELQTEVRFEPQSALYAPENGYLFYRMIPKLWKNKLKPGGMLAFEVGYTQAATVKTILIENGFVNVDTVKDLSGMQRVVYGYLK